jgi:hypothetical protein
LAYVVTYDLFGAENSCTTAIMSMLIRLKKQDHQFCAVEKQKLWKFRLQFERERNRLSFLDDIQGSQIWLGPYCVSKFDVNYKTCTNWR